MLVGGLVGGCVSCVHVCVCLSAELEQGDVNMFTSLVAGPFPVTQPLNT